MSSRARGILFITAIYERRIGLAIHSKAGTSPIHHQLDLHAFNYGEHYLVGIVVWHF